MEMFLDFCNSHYIPEEDIFKITTLPNNQSNGVPAAVVYQILMRGNKRFYNGDISYVKNLFQCNPSDDKPEYFLRLDILSWLYNKRNERGSSGFRGYHRAEKLIESMVARGYDSEVAQREINYLARALCVGTEHQRIDHVVLPEDLVTLAPAGYVHLDIVEDVHYIATCSEDIWYEESGPALKIAHRIGGGGFSQHFDPRTIMNNAKEATEYLKRLSENPEILPTEEFLENTEIQSVFSFARLQANIARDMRDYYGANYRK